MRSELAAALGRLFQTPPQAYAFLYGSDKYPDIHGVVYFYPFFEGTLVAAEAAGLPHMEDACRERVFGFHLHEGALCKGSPASPFEETDSHYNPEGCAHPAHA